MRQEVTVSQTGEKEAELEAAPVRLEAAGPIGPWWEQVETALSLDRPRRAEVQTPLPFLQQGLGKKDLCWALLFVSIQVVDWCKCAEEAVIFVVDSGGKEQRICRARIRVVPERERPETIDGYERIVFVLQESDEFVREAVERGDPAAPEISRTVARREHSAVNRELQTQ